MTLLLIVEEDGTGQRAPLITFYRVGGEVFIITGTGPMIDANIMAEPPVRPLFAGVVVFLIHEVFSFIHTDHPPFYKFYVEPFYFHFTPYSLRNHLFIEDVQFPVEWRGGLW